MPQSTKLLVSKCSLENFLISWGRTFQTADHADHGSVVFNKDSVVGSYASNCISHENPFKVLASDRVSQFAHFNEWYLIDTWGANLYRLSAIAVTFVDDNKAFHYFCSFLDM